MSTPLINGVRHSWASVKLVLLDRTVTGCSAIKYEDKQEKVNNYGTGIYPVSRGLGKYEAMASITLEQYEVEAIQAQLPKGKRIQDIAPFDVVVSFVNDSDALVNHTIRNCEFTNNKRELKSGDAKIETEYELITSHIEWS